MGHTRTLFISLLFLTLTACSGVEEKDNGLPPLSAAQKGEAASSVTKQDQVKRVLDVINGSKDVDKDIEDLVQFILSRCTIEEIDAGDEDRGYSVRKAVGENCTVTAAISEVWNKIPINGEVYEERTVEIKYSTSDSQALRLLDIEFFQSKAHLPAGGLPTFSSEIVFITAGRLTLDDTLTARLLSNNNVEATHFRRRRFDGYDVEVHVISEYEVITDENGEEDLEQVGQKFYLNGGKVTAQEAAAFFPEAFNRR